MPDHDEDVKSFIAEMLSPEIAQGMAAGENSGQFGAHLGRLAFDSVFDRLWMRPGLDRRSRSLVTLGILIALRATQELRFHIPMALKNGLSRNELEEVIYHASGYAGFPAAATACGVARELLDDQQSL